MCSSAFLLLAFLSSGVDCVRVIPSFGQAVVDHLNEAFMCFDEADYKSKLGVVITMVSNPTTFYGNIFCSVLPNPKGNTSCFNGQADCRLSVSLMNHKMMINQATGTVTVGLDRGVGYVLNEEMVENSWGKCSYVWDGATNNKYNLGCG